ncbi:MAG: hypothetical protein IKQ49_06685 [Eubacterium sp.]|nr:hypothetical protein [Eubacterium sp.]
MTEKLLSDEYHLNDEERSVFQEYSKNLFADAKEIENPDLHFLDFWERILLYSNMVGVDKAINERVCAKRPVDFRSPETLKLEIYDSLAGKIPIIYVRDTEDFEQLVTNLLHQGIRPKNISTTGASFVSSKSTRFIILSAKPYSNVPAVELGLPDETEWEEKSLILRRGHECTHYYTKQTYGITNNNLHDEIMADFIGMYEAFGFYKADWFLRFMGIIKGSGDRLQYYTGALSVNVRNAVSKLAELCAYKLEKWSLTDSFQNMTVGGRIKYMCKAGFDGLLQETWDIT